MTTAAVRQAVGAYGERVALRHLLGLGMVLLDRNWRCATGELDLVMRDGDVLVADTPDGLRERTGHENLEDAFVALVSEREETPA